MGLAILRTPRGIFAAVVLTLFALMPWIGPLVGQPYLLEIFIRIMIWSIAAISLNLILGFGGMVSFGHAAYIGIGGYTMGILSYYEIYSGWLHWPLALATSGLVALIFGAICLRTRGVYFIMITLAFAQMIYFLSVSAEEYGSDDGLPLDQRSEFAIGGWQFDISDNQTFYFIAFGFMLLALFITYKIVNSRFGMVVRGAKSNEPRMQAIGFPSYRYKLACFVISGMGCGLAGVLEANFEMYVSPDMLFWTRSGELIFMVVLGGMGSLFGPVAGTAVFLLLSEFLSEMPGLKEHWHLVFGPFLVLVVLFARKGIDGLFEIRPGRQAATGEAAGD